MPKEQPLIWGYYKSISWVLTTKCLVIVNSEDVDRLKTRRPGYADPKAYYKSYYKDVAKPINDEAKKMGLIPGSLEWKTHRAARQKAYRERVKKRESGT